MFRRSLALPPPGEETFFLWGPRKTGKSTLLKHLYPDALWLDLLKADEFRRYLDRPELLREQLLQKPVPFVVLDEVQRVPTLLDEVHWLHENLGTRFALCGSSARKVRRGHANLLGGRALRFELFGLTSQELVADFDLSRMLNHGYIPDHFQHDRPKQKLRAYVADYLKEEVAAEGLVRNLPTFSAFLDAAALSDGEIVNYTTIARDCGVTRPTIKGYFEILVDTLLGRWLPAYTARPKRRVIQSPKFYFSDVGVVNFLAARGELQPRSELFGKAFENWVFHELTSYNHYRERFVKLSYWRLASGLEVDFVVGRGALAIEAKASAKILPRHTKGLRAMLEDQPSLARRIVVCLEPRSRRIEGGIEIMSVDDFRSELWAGGLF